MGETDKPFLCPLLECGMRFTNEDHLTVHKKKHDMCLSIAGQKGSFVADQTPTPTRFIRNCEEVGLFQDLQNVNPFEEQFRKAAEAVKSGDTPLHAEVEPMCGQVDDTLHTPQVFPTDRLLVSTPHVPVSLASPVSIHHTPSLHPLTGSENAHKDLSLSEEQIINKEDNVELLLRLPDGKVLKLSAVEMKEAEASSSDAPIHSSSILSTPSVIVDEPLEDGQNRRTVLLMGNTKPVPQIVEPPPAKPPSDESTCRLAAVKQKLKQTLSANRKPATPTKPVPNKVVAIRENSNLLQVPSFVYPKVAIGRQKRTKEVAAIHFSNESSTDDPQTKRQKFLERNRAAAFRCRQKRKNWVGMLENRNSALAIVNQQLTSEVSSLKAEVANLKTLLLAHRDCPVTQAMNQAGVLPLVGPLDLTSPSSDIIVTSTQMTGTLKSVPAPTVITPGVIKIVPATSTYKSSSNPEIVGKIPISRKADMLVPSNLHPLMAPLHESAHIMCVPSKNDKAESMEDGPGPSYVITTPISDQDAQDAPVTKTVIVKNNL